MLEDHVLARQRVKRAQRAFSRELAEMVRYAVGYRSRAFVTFGRPIPLDGYDGESRRAVLDLAHLVRREIGRLYKVLPTAVLAAAMRPYIARADLDDRIDGDPGYAGATGANLGVDSADEAIWSAATEPLETRGIIVVEDGSTAFAIATSCATTAAASSTCSRPPARRTSGTAPCSHDRRRFEGLVPLARAGRRRCKRLASRYGMRAGRLRAPLHRRRDHRGSDRCGRAICRAAACGLTLDYLGESVASFDEADAAAHDYLAHHPAHIVDAGIERNISLKLTQLGLDVDRATAVDNMRRILEPADAHEFFVRIDMENSPYTDAHARDPRHAVAAGPSQRRHGDPVVPEAHRRRTSRRFERAGRARAPGEGRLQGAEDRRLPGRSRTWTPRSSS